jgi:hypothetical protein
VRERFGVALVALAALRVAFPLAALAASGHKLPGLPRYTYGPLTGDATGYLATARELISAAGRLRGWLLPIALAVLVAGGLALRVWRRRPDRRVWAVAGFAFVVALALAAAISRSTHVPAGAVGWPLLWSLPLLPLRAANRIGPDVSFAAGLVLALAANAASVVATGYAGRYAARSAHVGLLAAALFALWPVIPAAVVGSRAWENGTWNVDTGLALYTEPVSTACVAIGLALVLGPRTPVRLALAGVAFGYGIAVRPTNVVFIAVALLVLAALRAWSEAVYVAVGALTVAPIVLAFLPKKTGYDVGQAKDRAGRPLWSSHYVVDTFTHSHVWRPAMLALLVPIAAIGLFAVRSHAVAALLAGGVVANAAIYAFFVGTADHPRYLFAGLPALLVLWSAGAAFVVARARGKKIVRTGG